MSGGEGNDAVDGGPGDDVISGDQGSDSLSGDGGADRIAARDGRHDTVFCGPGADSVDADTFDTLAADCESVARTATQAPPVDRQRTAEPPLVDVGAPTLQTLGRSRVVRVYATSSERGALSASGSLTARGLTLPVKRIGRKRVRVPGAGAALRYRLTGRHWRWPRGRWSAAARSFCGWVWWARTRAVAQPAATRRRSSSPAARDRCARAAHPEPGDVDGDEVRDEVDNCPLAKNGGQANTDRPAVPARSTATATRATQTTTPTACPTLNPTTAVWCPIPDRRMRTRTASATPARRSTPTSTACSTSTTTATHTANPAQTDLDGDDRGDACDADVDGDRIDDPFDNCPTVYNLDRGVDRNGDGFVNQRDQVDRDGDGVGTACDPDELFVSVPPAPPPAAPATDRRAPRLVASVPRRQRLAAVRAGLVVRLRCSEACAATAELAVDRRRARRLGLGKVRIVASGSARLGGAGTTYAFVRFSRAARRPLFRRRAVPAILTAVAVDEAGNRRALRRRIDLRR